MDKSKIIPIILLIVILGVGLVAFNLYYENVKLKADKQKLEGEKSSLAEANSNLNYRFKRLEKEKSDVERRLEMIKDELSKTEAESESWRKKWSSVSGERDELIEKMKKASLDVKVVESAGTGDISEDHWVDFVKSKASLEAKLEVLSKTLFEERVKIAKMDKENKELSIQMDQMNKEKERLAEEIKLKERTLRIMSMDLVSERESRGSAVDEVKKLRRENVNLKKELVMANKELIKLQDTFKKVVNKKDALEDKIADADNILKEKSQAFEELQKELVQTIEGGKKVISDESASVELPPIVVKPATSGTRELRGEVIAVNHEEKFVVIDIGESSGLRPGAILKIMRAGKEIGAAEVIETRKEISAADIKEVASGYTVQEGDVTITR
jgi:chromosome segregation ATPase